MDRVALSADLSLSRLVYGMWRLTEGDTTPAHVQAKIEACLEQGITTLDQADIYGGYMAEEVMGAALTPAIRDQVEIVTKCGIVAPAGRHAGVPIKHYDTSPAHIGASVDHSLRLMGIERIDLLLIHRPDPFMDHHATGAALDGLVRAGKVHAVGTSNFKPHDWTLLQSAMETPLVTNQIELSLAAAQGFTNGDVAFLQERAVAPMAWSPLGGGGLLTGSSPITFKLRHVAQAQGTDAAAVAIAWLLVHPARIIPILGSNSLARIRGFAKAFDVEMPRSLWFELYSAALGTEVP